MNLRFSNLLIFILLFPLFISAQYLDLEFGDQGTVEYDLAVDYNSAILDTDSLGRIYLETRIVDTTLTSNDSWSLLIRFNSNGEIDNSFADNGQLTVMRDSSNTLTNFNIFFKDNKIFERNIENDTGHLVMYDLNLNEENTYPISDELALWYYNIHVLDNNELLMSTYNDWYRYDENGILISPYGQNTNGVNNFTPTINDSLITSSSFIFSSEPTESNELYFSTIGYDSSNTAYSWISKFNIETGEVDLDFGDNGLALIQEYLSALYAFNIQEGKNNSIYATSFTTNDSLSSIGYLYLTNKLTEEGELDLSFGDNGNLIPMLDTDAFYQYSFLLGQDNYNDRLINNSTELFYNEDSTAFNYNYYLNSFDLDGQLDTSFADNGYLDLGFLPGEYLFHIKMTESGDIFTVTSDSAGLNNILYLSKLDTKNLFGIPEPEVTQSEKILLYPNPNNGRVFFNYTGQELVNEIDFYLYTMQGHFISKTNLDLGPHGQINNFLDLGDLAEGAYILKAVSETGRRLITEKLFISN